MTARISVRGGSVYLPAETAERYFRDVEAVAVLIDDSLLRILPLHRMATGGTLLKRRTAAGDRVASAWDAFAERGLATWEAEDLPARWSASSGSLDVCLDNKL